MQWNHTAERRFFAKVNWSGPLPDYNPSLGPCWIWTAATYRNGYGSFGTNGRNSGTRLVHRFAYELLVGPIPKGLDLDHLCRVRHCVRPKHLEPVTRLENVRRGNGGLHQRQKTHCSNGHPFDKANTRNYQGRRYCRTCKRINRRDRRRRLAAK